MKRSWDERDCRFTGFLNILRVSFTKLKEKTGLKDFFMKFTRRIHRLFSRRRDLVPILSQQGAFLCHTSEALVSMLETTDPAAWKRGEREIKTCEVQGDALLTEFNEQLAGRIFGSLSRMDLQVIAMSMDDCLDVIKDAAKAVLIYHPAKIDPQLKDLAGIIKSEAEAIKVLLPLLWDIRHKHTDISLQCDRVTELEHAADDVYEEYVGYIFSNEPDLREMTKYKTLAEIFEKATDSEKRVADNVRTLLLKYVDD